MGRRRRRPRPSPHPRPCPRRAAPKQAGARSRSTTCCPTRRIGPASQPPMWPRQAEHSGRQAVARAIARQQPERGRAWPGRRPRRGRRGQRRTARRYLAPACCNALLAFVLLGQTSLPLSSFLQNRRTSGWSRCPPCTAASQVGGQRGVLGRPRSRAIGGCQCAFPVCQAGLATGHTPALHAACLQASRCTRRWGATLRRWPRAAPATSRMSGCAAATQMTARSEEARQPALGSPAAHAWMHSYRQRPVRSLHCWPRTRAMRRTTACMETLPWAARLKSARFAVGRHAPPLGARDRRQRQRRRPSCGRAGSRASRP